MLSVSKSGRTKWQLTAISSVMHMLVDGLCICSLYLVSQTLPVQSLAGIFLTYNALAFLTQPLTGAWADKTGRRHWMLLAAVVLLTVAVMASSAVVTVGATTTGLLTVAVLAGAGNSLFHAWGGKQVAVWTGNDIRAIGMFVSTGVIGLSVGFVFFSWPLLYAFLLCVSLLAVVYLNYDTETADPKPVNRHHLSTTVAATAVAMLMGAVMLRSFVGQNFSAGLGGSSTMVLTVGLVSMAGKMMGGWIARSLGIVLSLVLMVLVAVVCYIGRSYGLAILLTGAFAVNCTMPVTLYLANSVLPGREGLAFGLLAAALIPGYLLAMI